MAIGLALTTRPALLQLLAIDGSGRELSVLETLPHAVTEAACGATDSRMALAWLAADLDTRVREGRRWPEMLLVIENVSTLAANESGTGRHALLRILRTGGAWGIHILAGASGLDGGLRTAGFARPDVARLTAEEPEGWFALSSGGRPTRIDGARVAAVDLDRVARGYRPAAEGSPDHARRSFWPRTTEDRR